MTIAVLCKLVPDPDEIEVAADGTADLTRAPWRISDYDLQAVETAVRLGAATSSPVTVISAGPAQIEASALRKDVLSRGPDELCLVVDDQLADADTAQLAEVLAAAVQRIGADLVIAGEGSADRYCQQTGLQVGARLGWTVLNGVDAVSATDDGLQVERLLEDEIELLTVARPAALAVTSSILTPPLPTMRGILSAGKKPVTVLRLAELGFDALPTARVQVVATARPESPERKQLTLSGDPAAIAEQLLASLRQEGVLR